MTIRRSDCTPTTARFSLSHIGTSLKPTMVALCGSSLTEKLTMRQPGYTRQSLWPGKATPTRPTWSSETCASRQRRCVFQRIGVKPASCLSLQCSATKVQSASSPSNAASTKSTVRDSTIVVASSHSSLVATLAVGHVFSSRSSVIRNETRGTFSSRVTRMILTLTTPMTSLTRVRSF